MLASDGLWDFMSPDAVVHLVSDHISGKRTLGPFTLPQQRLKVRNVSTRFLRMLITFSHSLACERTAHTLCRRRTSTARQQRRHAYYAICNWRSGTDHAVLATGKSYCKSVKGNVYFVALVPAHATRSSARLPRRHHRADHLLQGG